MDQRYYFIEMKAQAMSDYALQFCMRNDSNGYRLLRMDISHNAAMQCVFIIRIAFFCCAACARARGVVFGQR